MCHGTSSHITLMLDVATRSIFIRDGTNSRSSHEMLTLQSSINCHSLHYDPWLNQPLSHVTRKTYAPWPSLAWAFLSRTVTSKAIHWGRLTSGEWRSLYHRWERWAEALTPPQRGMGTQYSYRPPPTSWLPPSPQPQRLPSRETWTRPRWVTALWQALPWRVSDLLM